MEDFVTFEIAKKLKEKGFRKPCFGWYYPCEVCGYDYRTLIVSNYSEYRGDKYKDLLISHNDDKHIDAPTISQTLKWLREEKGYHVCIALGKFSDWVYDISKIEYNEFCETMDDFHSYEEAAFAGIKYILDNLI